MKSSNLGWACILYLAGLAVVYKGKYERRNQNQRNQRNQPVTQRQRQVIKSIQGALRLKRGSRFAVPVKRQRTKDVWVGPRDVDLNAPFARVAKPGDIKKKEELK